MRRSVLSRRYAARWYIRLRSRAQRCPFDESERRCAHCAFDAGPLLGSPPMNSRLPIACAALLALASCVTPSSSPSSYSPGPVTAARPGDRPGDHPPQPSSQSAYSAPPATTQSAPARREFEWDEGRALMQGFLGASLFEHVSVDGGNGVEIDGDDG